MFSGPEQCSHLQPTSYTLALISPAQKSFTHPPLHSNLRAKPTTPPPSPHPHSCSLEHCFIYIYKFNKALNEHTLGQANVSMSATFDDREVTVSLNINECTDAPPPPFFFSLSFPCFFFFFFFFRLLHLLSSSSRNSKTLIGRQSTPSASSSFEVALYRDCNVC